MVKPPSCEKLQMEEGFGRGDEDAKELRYLSKHGIGNCRAMPKKTGEKKYLKSLLDIKSLEAGFQRRWGGLKQWMEPKKGAGVTFVLTFIKIILSFCLFRFVNSFFRVCPPIF